MSYTLPIEKEMVCARCTSNVSEKASVKLCRHLNRMIFAKALKEADAICNEKKSIDGKYHTKAAKEIQKLLLSAEKNAKVRNIEPEGMEIILSAHRGPTMMRGRRKRNFGMRMKSTHLQVVLRPKK